MSAVRPRDPEVWAEPWPETPRAVTAQVAEVVDLDLVRDRRAASTVPDDPPVAAPAHRPTWTQIALACSALTGPWVWAVVASQLPLPTEQRGIALILGWLGMAVVAGSVADPRRHR